MRARCFLRLSLVLFAVAFFSCNASAQFQEKKALTLTAAKKMAAAAEAEAVKIGNMRPRRDNAKPRIIGG